MCASAYVRERFGRRCCRETIRIALHRLTLSWKKAKMLLGRANPERREAFVEQLQGLLAGAQRDRHLLVYVDEAHIHQDADLGYGWAVAGPSAGSVSGSPPPRRAYPRGSPSMGCISTTKARGASGPIGAPTVNTRSMSCVGCGPSSPMR